MSSDRVSLPPQDLASLSMTLRHDLRTPLNLIINYAEILEEDAADDLRPDLAKIHGAARNMIAMIEDGIERLVRAAGADPGRPAVAKAAEAAASAEVAAVEPRAPSDEAHLLIVDDNEMNTDMLARRFVKRGFRADIASDGLKALEMIQAGAYDAVILDIMMPGISGLEVLERIRKTHSAVDLPVIMATGALGNDAIVNSLNLGANDYVRKPIDLSVLLARLDAHLALKRTNAEVKRLANELSERNDFIKSVFGRYTSDQVVNTLLASSDALSLGGRAQTVTILLSDLRGFSSISERLTAPDVIALLNEYLGTMTEIIQAHGGTIDEFIGDAILVLFGAPLVRDDDALRSVRCAVEMQRAMLAINERNGKRGLPAVEMGIGINTGEVVLGNIGSERRAKYGVVGRNVNLASRIEAFTVGGQILISDATLQAAGTAVALRRSAEVFPKGSKTPMTVHDVAGVTGEGGAFLLEQGSQLRALRMAAQISIAPVDGVAVRADPQSAAIIQVSAQRAVVRLDAPLEVAKLSTVRITFEGLAASDSYAKVVETEGDLLIHFTSLAPAAAVRMKELLAAAERTETP